MTAPPPDTSDAALVEHFAEDMVRRWRAGDRPLVEEYLDRHPDLWHRPAAGLELIAAEDDPHEGHDHGDAHEGETDAEHADEEHAEDGHEGHDHGAFDPHVWTDPANAIVQAEAVRDAVAAADPDADIDASAAAYLAQLVAELDAQGHATQEFDVGVVTPSGPASPA